MYHDVAYRNDELKRDLEHASEAAELGWRFRLRQSRRPSLLASAMSILGSVFVTVGEWLAARGRSTLPGST